MKLVLTLAMVLGATSVFATKARLIALGQDKDGSYYVDDSRNMFRNAAHINDYGSFGVFEWGDDGLASQTRYVETDENPKAEGGFIKSQGNMSWGLYMGAESNTAVLLKNLAAADAADNTTGAGTMYQSDNVIELFVGGRHAVDWAAAIGTGTNDVEGDATNVNVGEQKSIFTRFGVKKNNWEAFANISLQGESTRKDPADSTKEFKYDGDIGLEFGGAYDWKGNHFFGKYQKIGWDQTNTSVQAGAVEGSFNKMILGWGKTHNVNKSARINYDVTYTKKEAELKYTSNPVKVETMLLPVNIGFEVDVKSWLTVRGSVTQNLTSSAKATNIGSHFITTPGANAGYILTSSLLTEFGLSSAADGKSTIANSTVVAGGATLDFGKLKIDGLIGTTNGSGTDSGVKDGNLALDRLMTRVAMIYNF